MSKNPSVKDWLANSPPELRAITKQLRAMARKQMPGAHEFIYHDAVGYSVSDSPFDRICYIAPQKKGYVNFGFFFGAGLLDPKKAIDRGRKTVEARQSLECRRIEKSRPCKTRRSDLEKRC